MEGQPELQRLLQLAEAAPRFEEPLALFKESFVLHEPQISTSVELEQKHFVRTYEIKKNILQDKGIRAYGFEEMFRALSELKPSAVRASFLNDDKYAFIFVTDAKLANLLGLLAIPVQERMVVKCQTQQ